jgi:hypothetical protein
MNFNLYKLKFKMDLPSDIWKTIISISKIKYIKTICLISKAFYFLCIERNLWLDKFKEKNLKMINNKINTVSQYIGEYKELSHATYTANCLIDMITCDKYAIQWHFCSFNLGFSIDKLTKIVGDHFHTKIKDIVDIDKYKYIKISILVENRSIRYKLFKTDNKDDIGILIFTEDPDKDYIISLVNKILYHYPLLNLNDINDFNGLPLKIPENDIVLYNQFYKCNTSVRIRKEYWDRCYSKYEEQYF